MTITSRRIWRSGNATTVRVASDLEGTVRYHWYIDGEWAGVTASCQRTFIADRNSRVQVDVIDTTDADFDYMANAPSVLPGRRLVEWTAPSGDEIAKFVLQYQEDGGDWTTFATVPHDSRKWLYSYYTPELTDLADVVVHVVPYDAAGNAATAVTLLEETILRKPAGVNFTITYTGGGTNTVTFAEA